MALISLTGIPLQIDSAIAQALNSNPSYVLLLIVFTAGYAFLALSARRTSFWEKATPNEKVLVGVGIGGGFASMMFFLLWAFYYSIKAGFDPTTIYYGSLIFSSFALILISLHPRSQKIPEEKTRRLMSIVSGAIFYFSTTVMMFYLILFFEVIAVYQAPTKEVVLGLIVWNLIYWSFSAFLSGIFFFSYTNYFFRQLRGYIYLDDFSSELKTNKLDSSITRIVRRFNQLPASGKTGTILVIALLLSSGWVTLDHSTVAFTPQISWSPATPYSVSSVMFKVPAVYFLSIQNNFSDWSVNYTGPCNMTEYQLVSQTYKIKIPWDSYYAINNAQLPYPNSTDQIPVNFSRIQSLTYAEYPAWQNMFVLNQSGVGMTYTQSNIALDLSKLKHPSTASIEIAYFKIDNPNISCQESFQFVRTSNGNNMTLSDMQKIDIKNNENFTAIIQLVDLPFYARSPYARFTQFYNGTASNSSMVFYNPGNYLGALGYNPSFDYVLPSYETNYTITGSCNTGSQNTTLGSGSCVG
jgi:hypothetical protein